MKIPEAKITQLTELLNGLTAVQFSLLIQQANSFYSNHQSKVQLTDDDLKRIEANCRREFT